MSLDVGVQDHGRLGVAQGAAVLIQEVHQLLGDEAGGEEELLPPELVQNYLNESLKCIEKTLPPGGLSIGSLDTKPIQLDSKLLLSSQLGILEKK
jgi:hypothetical protein